MSPDKLFVKRGQKVVGPYTMAKIRDALTESKVDDLQKITMNNEDLCAYELCMPGSITGQGEAVCPACGTTLVVPIDDANGKQNYQCSRCFGAFQVDWSKF